MHYSSPSVEEEAEAGGSDVGPLSRLEVQPGTSLRPENRNARVSEKPPLSSRHSWKVWSHRWWLVLGFFSFSLLFKDPQGQCPGTQTFWEPPGGPGQEKIAFFLSICIKTVRKISGCARHMEKFGNPRGGGWQAPSTSPGGPNIKKKPGWCPKTS